MLKQTPPSRLRRGAGTIAGLALASVVAGTVYAASAASALHAAAPKLVAASEYQLDMMVELGTDGGHANHVERAALALCMAPHESGSVMTHGWKIEATSVPEADNRIHLDMTVTGAGGEPVAHVQWHGKLGESLHANGHGEDGKHQYAIDVTPQAGCPARTATAETGARLFMINQNVKDQPARAVAESMASKAGLDLTNPEALDNRLVTLNFEQIPAEHALQLVADIDGKKALFDGKQVGFESK